MSVETPDDRKRRRTDYVFDSTQHAPVVYNPMMGTRRDLEVDREDGAAADKRHQTWVEKRRAFLETRIADVTTSDFARDCYQRELAKL